MNAKTIESTHLFVAQQLEYVQRAGEFDVLRIFGRESDFLEVSTEKVL